MPVLAPGLPDGRQGRIGVIINAKPSERRILLEEAANIRGLYARRREAKRLQAAETNLERLEDVLKALEGQLHRLRQRARQAQRYRTVSEQMRSADLYCCSGVGKRSRRKGGCR